MLGHIQSCLGQCVLRDEYIHEAGRAGQTGWLCLPLECPDHELQRPCTWGPRFQHYRTQKKWQYVSAVFVGHADREQGSRRNWEDRHKISPHCSCLEKQWFFCLCCAANTWKGAKIACQIPLRRTLVAIRLLSQFLDSSPWRLHKRACPWEKCEQDLLH